MNIENNPFMSKRLASPDTVCSNCGAHGLEIVSMILSGPYSGSVKCNQCGHSESVMSYLGKRIFKVEPLPTPNIVHYMKDDL